MQVRENRTPIFSTKIFMGVLFFHFLASKIQVQTPIFKKVGVLFSCVCVESELFTGHLVIISESKLLPTYLSTGNLNEYRNSNV